MSETELPELWMCGGWVTLFYYGNEEDLEQAERAAQDMAEANPGLEVTLAVPDHMYKGLEE